MPPPVVPRIDDAFPVAPTVAHTLMQEMYRKEKFKANTLGPLLGLTPGQVKRILNGTLPRIDHAFGIQGVLGIPVEAWAQHARELAIRELLAERKRKAEAKAAKRLAANPPDPTTLPGQIELIADALDPPPLNWWEEGAIL